MKCWFTGNHSASLAYCETDAKDKPVLTDELPCTNYETADKSEAVFLWGASFTVFILIRRIHDVLLRKHNNDYPAIGRETD